MLYCGLLCRGCSAASCSDPPTEAMPLELQCSYCDGMGCEQCDNGYTTVTQCPRMEVGSQISRELRLVSHAMQDKLLPDAGGINDQDAKFIHLWQAFASDVNMIEKEEAKRGK